MVRSRTRYSVSFSAKQGASNALSGPSRRSRGTVLAPPERSCKRTYNQRSRPRWTTDFGRYGRESNEPGGAVSGGRSRRHRRDACIGWRRPSIRRTDGCIGHFTSSRHPLCAAGHRGFRWFPRRFPDVSLKLASNDTLRTAQPVAGAVRTCVGVCPRWRPGSGALGGRFCVTSLVAVFI
jgi:hypothetical protein